TPRVFMKLTATASNPTVSQRNINGKKYTVVSFPVEQKAQSGQAYTITGYIDEQNLVAKVETKIEDNIIGDMLVEQTYSGYKDFSGVKFPTRIVQTRAGLAWTDLTVADVKSNGTAPQPVAAAGGRGGAGGAGRGAPAEGRGAPAEGRGGAPGGGRGAAPAVSAKKL